ncbi:MAG: MFS transporter [Bacillota bacterium]
MGSFVFESPIFIIFLTYKGLSYSEITLLFSLYAFAVVSFEYITGVIADKYSRKGILIFSTSALVLGELFFIFGTSFMLHAVGIIMIALSTASRSGADIAYLYDKLKDMNFEDEFNDIISSLRSITLFISAGACILGSFITVFSMNIPLWGTVFFSAFSILMLTQFREPSIRQRELSTSRILIDSYKNISENKTVFKYVLLSILIFPSFHILDQLLQPYLGINSIRIEYFGIFYTALSVFQALGTKLSGKLLKKHSSEKLLNLSVHLIIIGFLLMYFDSNFIVFIIPVIMGTAFGIYYNVNNISVNKHIESRVRASVLSLQHALTKVMQMSMFGVISLFIDNNQLRHIFLAFAVFLLIMNSSLLFFIRAKQSSISYEKTES